MNTAHIIARHFLAKALKIAGEGKYLPERFGDTSTIAELLSRTLFLSSQKNMPSDEPIRSIHHLPCTGGTLFSKCIASMGNVVVLNEIDYSSQIAARKSHPRFTPTDVLALIRQSGETPNEEFIGQLFIESMRLLRNDLWRSGQTLILRDHSHSQFLVGKKTPAHPILLDRLRTAFNTISIVTVRDPVDSYASMVQNGFHKHYEPSGFDEYCRRHCEFLKRHRHCAVFKYENFTAAPEQTMSLICDALELHYFPDFMSVFDSFEFSGDSGRRGAIIEKRPRRLISTELQLEISQSPNYAALCEVLDYESLS